MMRRRMVGRSVALWQSEGGGCRYSGCRQPSPTAEICQSRCAAQQQQDQAYQQGAADQQAQLQAQQAPAPPPPVATPAAPEEDIYVKLQKLGDMHASGVLTDEEFTAAKQKLLAS